MEKDMKQEGARPRKSMSDRLNNALARDGNLSRLLTSASAPTNAVPGFRDRLFYQMAAARDAKPRKLLWRFLAAAICTVAVVVVLVGMVVYPYFWASSGVSLTASINQGTAAITQTKPWFFSWGSNVAHYSLKHGDSVSLAEGDRITTGADTLVVLSMFNKSSVKIYPNSELVVSELQARDAEDPYLVRLLLNSGRATSRVTGIDYGLETPVAATRVLGTDFTTAIINNDHTNLATNEGAVQVSMEGKTVQVAAGEEVQAIRGQPLVITSQRSPQIGLTAYGIGNTRVWPSINASQRLPEITLEQRARPGVTSSQLTISGRTDPEATVTINGYPRPTDLDGGFSITMGLKPGPNEITISATSRAGKTTTVNMVFILPETK
jgi:hypothetical protein